jgi:hypothetical protein
MIALLHIRGFSAANWQILRANNNRLRPADWRVRGAHGLWGTVDRRSF